MFFFFITEPTILFDKSVSPFVRKTEIGGYVIFSAHIQDRLLKLISNIITKIHGSRTFFSILIHDFFVF